MPPLSSYHERILRKWIDYFCGKQVLDSHELEGLADCIFHPQLLTLNPAFRRVCKNRKLFDAVEYLHDLSGRNHLKNAHDLEKYYLKQRNSLRNDIKGIPDKFNAPD